MRTALKGVPEMQPEPPPGVISARIDPETGLQSPDGFIAEYFYREFLPPTDATATAERGDDRAPSRKSATSCSNMDRDAEGSAFPDFGEHAAPLSARV